LRVLFLSFLLKNSLFSGFALNWTKPYVTHTNDEMKPKLETLIFLLIFFCTYFNGKANSSATTRQYSVFKYSCPDKWVLFYLLGFLSFEIFVCLWEFLMFYKHYPFLYSISITQFCTEISANFVGDSTFSLAYPSRGIKWKERCRRQTLKLSNVWNSLKGTLIFEG
jgi:hypothetical protein